MFIIFLIALYKMSCITQKRPNMKNETKPRFLINSNLMPHTVNSGMYNIKVNLKKDWPQK